MRTSRDKADLERYASDESRFAGQAEEVAWPANVEECAALLAQATREGRPVTVSGAGTGVVGGRVPEGGLVLALDHLVGVLGVDAAAAGGPCVRALAGTTLDALRDTVRKEGFLYPPDPTEWGASVGGSIATNASGSRTYRFGPTRAWVRALTLALPTGDAITLVRGQCWARAGTFTLERDGEPPLEIPAPSWHAPRTTKHVAGYYSAAGMDLVDLFVGSEGTLGVIVEAELGLVPYPEEILSGLLFFCDESRAFDLVDAARDADGAAIDPLCLEYFGPGALALLRRSGLELPEGAQTAILFEQDCARAEYDARLEAWLELAAEWGAHEGSWLAEGPSDHERFREFRHRIPVTINETLARRGVRKVSTDTAVPRGQLPGMLATYRRLLGEAGLEYVEFGHVGNDHVHVNVIPRDAREQELAAELYGTLLREAVSLGGTISGEHGLGKTKARYLGLLYSEKEIEAMRAVKRALDPAGILGRGTLLDAAPDSA